MRSELLVVGVILAAALEAVAAGGPGRVSKASRRIDPAGGRPRQSTSSMCGDERDAIIREYVDRGLSIVPSCEHFSADRGSSRFSFAEMNGGDHHWAWIEMDLLNGLENTRLEYGAPMVITSGYRCPERNETVSGVRNSPHQFGRAADVSAETHDEQRALGALAVKFGAKKVLGLPRYPRHVHMEW